MRKPIRFLGLLLGFLIPLFSSAQQRQRYDIIPRPERLEPQQGEFRLSRQTVLIVPPSRPDIRAVADTLARQLYVSGGFKTPIQSTTAAASAIEWAVNPNLPAEAYRLLVNPNRIRIETATAAGAFYAVQTLRQLLPASALAAQPMLLPDGLAEWPVPACQIEDGPRYTYRGLHLDVSRHFFSVAAVKRYLDLMAFHKFNVFHWHLTDDQGWRIDIKKYPRLTQIGARRSETIIGHYDQFDPQRYDGKPVSGFYTQDEIREVVRYAAAKFITIVPEIEMPGHALAALAAYPELGCTNANPAVATKWGIFEQVFCPKPQTFAFLKDVLSEVMGLFPGPYVHIGGDECPKQEWLRSTFCRQLMKQKGLKTGHQLQLYFVRQIESFLIDNGKQMIGWDELLDGNTPALRLSPKSAIMVWRNAHSGLQAAQKGHDVIMSPGKFCYLDHLQGDPAQEPTGFGGSLPLETVYTYNPTPPDVPAAVARRIRGVQGNVWTEYIADEPQLNYMVWPRAAALAEVAWTAADRKSYSDFLNRLPTLFQRLGRLGVTYSRAVYDRIPTAKPNLNGTLTVSIPTHTLPAGAAIRYTSDGSEPTAQSPVYTTPFSLTQTSTIRTAVWMGQEPLSDAGKVRRTFRVSKATGKAYTWLTPPKPQRPDPNLNLTNGILAGVGGYEVNDIVSFAGNAGLVLDLGLAQSISKLRMGFLNYTAKQMCLPTQLTVSVSDDAKTFREVAVMPVSSDSRQREVVRIEVLFAPVTARYVRVVAQSPIRVPAGLRYSGRVAQMGVDELEID